MYGSKTLQLLRKATVCTAFAVSSAAPAFAQVTQSTTPASASTCCWAPPVDLGTITFAHGTNYISALTSQAIVTDQGWGGYDPNNNHVVLQLWNNATSLWWVHAAGGLRYDYSVQYFDIAAHPSELATLNSVMGAIDWSTTPTVQMRMTMYGLGYPGWELHAQDASFSVTSSVVPEPATITLMGTGLVAVAFLRRRKKQAV